MRSRQLSTLAVLSVLSLVLTACSASVAPGPGPENAYADDIAWAQENATSDFERAVLQDGKITAAEFEEAIQRYVDCAAGHGFALTPQFEDGVGYTGMQVAGGTAEYDVEVYDTVVEPGCSPGTQRLIEPLYIAMTHNPEKRPPEDVIAECLVETGVVAAPFTGTDLRRLEEQMPGSVNVELQVGDGGVEVAPPTGEPAQVDPLAAKITADDDYRRCVLHPRFYVAESEG